ncbi:hypothetical protein BFP70_15205 [Thioclava sp. SK-1]|uniref:hypothetical protein n=1 Tax=Thioclava sp. SK-1 TaxID=1889770 RepID=UPI00082612C3|nr:hypothetical protein [Thioclava sp. SK-1]OCX61653.1 hypothetical protein BFP70_15205 [Thioclava sp. SK-1]
MAELTSQDLRASVAAGQLTEAQAASILALAQTRAGYRSAMSNEDEPFELFRGFAEIFVTVGLSILFFAAFGLIGLAGGGAVALIIVPLTVVLAEYFTRRRRMVLPSMFLTTALAVAIAWAASDATDPISLISNRSGVLLALGLTVAGLFLWFLRYRVPFTMFLIGLCGFLAIVDPRSVFAVMMPGSQGLRSAMDLTQADSAGLAMLIFGLLALAGGIWFDMRDPHRLGRQSASGFWLHVLAAPALVNTVAVTFFNMGPGSGYGLLTLTLLVAAVLALVIDRRSFLTAGLGYMVFLLIYVFADDQKPLSWLVTLLVLGAGLTALGAGWTALRGRLMRMLPDFPGKTRLPPYTE